MTPDQKILSAKARLMFDHPFFGTLICQLRLVDATDDPRFSTMATDGKVLLFHGPFVLGLKPAELLFVLAHEVMHNAFDHHTRRGLRNPRLWNIAADYAINGELVACKVGTMPKEGLIDARFTGLSAEEIYRILEDEQPPSSGGAGAGGESESQDPGGCGETIPAAAPHEESKLREARAEMQTQVRQAAAIAKARNAGTLPGPISRIVDIILDPVIDWRAVFRRFVDESQCRDYTWPRPNKRMLPQGLYFPTLISDGLSHLVVAIDTSGSINNDDLAAFSAEVNGAFGDGTIDKITVIYADAAVQRVDEYETGDIVHMTPAGGGGTRFSPTFEWIRENVQSASCVVYFTDLYVSDFGDEPAYPVLWAVRGDRRAFDELAAKTPFGEALYVKAA